MAPAALPGTLHGGSRSYSNARPLNDFPFPAAGFVHVIDDEMKWDAAFGRSVLAGLLGLDANVGKV